KSRDMDKIQSQASPGAIAQAAKQAGALSVAYTYNDPVIFAEYAMDTADACRELGIHSVAVTAGYIHAAPRAEFYARMDAANVDLKGFTERFYAELCAAKLAPVLDTLTYIKHETDCWLEITTLLIPGQNDSDAEVRALSKWVRAELGPDVPLHFTAFHPDHKMRDTGATPAQTVKHARRIALEEGLHYVYTGNIHDAEGGATYCPGCGEKLIDRDWHDVGGYRISAASRCMKCKTHIAGRFSEFKQPFGRRRIPVVIA
ncbi:MAG TPA: AmmeMemoRadiSam system radical SAM enzyme, partial [Burkholderiales bacterium]|nr:AmmeMemoRadiSam system radical SAM enzyme [Burkholderiales bacterium]